MRFWTQQWPICRLQKFIYSRMSKTLVSQSKGITRELISIQRIDAAIGLGSDMGDVINVSITNRKKPPRKDRKVIQQFVCTKTLNCILGMRFVARSMHSGQCRSTKENSSSASKKLKCSCRPASTLFSGGACSLYFAIMPSSWAHLTHVEPTSKPSHSGTSFNLRWPSYA